MLADPEGAGVGAARRDCGLAKASKAAAEGIAEGTPDGRRDPVAVGG